MRHALVVSSRLVLCAGVLLSANANRLVFAQAPPAPQAGRGPQLPPVVSPQLAADRRVTFRIAAPQADAVRLTAGDIPGIGQASQLTKGEDGVWEITVGPIDPGAYRYNFNVDGVATIDPRNPFTSESNNNVWSLVVVPGSEYSDTANVAHGAVGAVTYYSSALATFRRMHVYTPPGYETSTAKYPVFYLLHGAGDSDDSWTSVGRAGFILDNLIAAKKAKPMIVVMPAGHTTRGTAPGGVAGRNATQEFVNDFVKDVLPYVESHYRVMADRSSRAIAGLSMGGNHALQVGIPHLDKFAYIGVYSSGLIGAFPQLAPARGAAPPAVAAAAVAAPLPAAAAPTAPASTAMVAADWEHANTAMLDNASLKKGLKLFWFATGKEDRLITTTAATVDLFKKHGFAPVFKESPGGHTWINWRSYLNEFVPQLFQ
jgi:enterochelin esterase-like enzyme